MNGENEIYFAGGCFWGVEEFFSRIPGVLDASSGYANGHTKNPTYEQVCGHTTGFAETVRVLYDPQAVSLEALTRQFYRIIDPTSVNRQGSDTGDQYRTGIYYTREDDRETAEAVTREIARQYAAPLAVELMPLENFYPAEEFHQDYLKKHPDGYCHIDFGSLADCGEDAAYKKPPRETLAQTLTPEQFAVTQENATERPFTGAYWDHHAPGLYVDIVTGEPLFTSDDKFDSGCGWPSFSRPVKRDAVIERRDDSHGMNRTEVKSRYGGSHLGHVFPDGPAEQGGLRYCINSAALRFIPYDDLEQEGFNAYKKLIKP